VSVGSPSLVATPPQELLLRAAVMDGPAAVAAWQAWSRTVNIETDLDHGSFRLLSLVYVNLQRLRVDDPLMGRLKGIYRQAWSRNQTLFHDLAPVVERLRAAGIRTLLLKGAPLSLLHYRNNGARPMSDLDLLVPHGQARAAHDLLVAAGWTATPVLTEGLLRYDHSVPLTNAAGRELDLHWRLFHGCCAAAEDEFWEGAVPVTMAGATTLAPNVTDLLFHTVIHGMAWNPEPPIRWVADALALLRTPDAAVDWPRLLRLAERHRVSLRLRNGLEYLCGRFGAPVPPAVLTALRRRFVGHFERQEYRFLQTPLEVRKARPYLTLAYHFFVYRRLTAQGQCPLPGGFAAYLRWVLHAESNTELLCRMARRGLRVTGVRLGCRRRLAQA